MRHTATLSAALATAERLAQEPGRLQMRERATLTVHGWKAHANDLVSEVDLASERLIADGLRAAFPADGVLAEEGANSAGTSGRRWIVGPLDGTRNYVTGAGPWSVCIALQDGVDTVTAVVHDPGARETFTAIRGAGAALNRQPIRASGCARLAEAIVGFSFNPSPPVKREMARIMSTLIVSPPLAGMLSFASTSVVTGHDRVATATDSGDLRRHIPESRPTARGSGGRDDPSR